MTCIDVTDFPKGPTRDFSNLGVVRSLLILSVDFIVKKMKLRIQTLTGETQEVEADPKDTILDLKVCVKLHNTDR